MWGTTDFQSLCGYFKSLICNKINWLLLIIKDGRDAVIYEYIQVPKINHTIISMNYTIIFELSTLDTNCKKIQNN